jgi:hypothetical protein
LTHQSLRYRVQNGRRPLFTKSDLWTNAFISAAVYEGIFLLTTNVNGSRLLVSIHGLMATFQFIPIIFGGVVFSFFGSLPMGLVAYPGLVVQIWSLLFLYKKFF